jgi:hypothetical protein
MTKQRKERMEGVQSATKKSRGAPFLFQSLEIREKEKRNDK